MSHRGTTFGDFLTGLLVGGAVGYVIALVNAPRPGEETRQILTERGRELREKAVETIQQTKDKTGKLAAEGRERLTETLESTTIRTRDRAVDLRVQGESLLHDVREQASEKMRQVADTIDPNTTTRPTNTPTGGDPSI